MKKIGFLNKITIIDILIIICIIVTIGFAISHMVDDDSSTATATSFDSSTKGKILETYLNHYKEGNIVTSTIVGTKDNGEKVELHGKVLWLGESENENINILLEDNGEKMLTGFYKNNPNADVYIDQISLETNGEKYSKVTDFKIAPMEISSIDDLISKIPEGTEYELSTGISVGELDSIKHQNLINALNNNKKPCLILNTGKRAIELTRANKTDLELANQIIGDLKGQTSPIQLRIFNSTDNISESIQTNFNVLSINQVSQ